VNYRGDVSGGEMRKGGSVFQYLLLLFILYHYPYYLVVARETRFHKHFEETRWNFRILDKLKVRSIYGSVNTYGNASKTLHIKGSCLYCVIV
jgi:hypothetical protein